MAYDFGLTQTEIKHIITISLQEPYYTLHNDMTMKNTLLNTINYIQL